MTRQSGHDVHLADLLRTGHGKSQQSKTCQELGNSGPLVKEGGDVISQHPRHGLFISISHTLSHSFYWEKSSSFQVKVSRNSSQFIRLCLASRLSWSRSSSEALIATMGRMCSAFMPLVELLRLRTGQKLSKYVLLR